jgi:manganese oxidase
MKAMRALLATATAVGASIALVACGSVAGTAHVSAGHHALGLRKGSGGTTRRYYIAADVVDWDYAPSGKNLITGQDFTDDENVFVGSGPDRIGRVYKKSLYREYTDATFTKLKPRPAKWEHLGMLGPVVQAEVGDKIVVTFRNNTPYPSSIHPHGVFYKKDSEGAPYADGTTGADTADDAVPQGGTHVYRWGVPERAGPGPHDGSSVMWMYHSHTNDVPDQYSGLIGPMIVTRRGMARSDGSPKDVDRQFVTMFEVSDENQSPWLQQNEEAHEVDSAEEEDEEFGESNLMHSINGYVYGNLPGLTMKKGEHVRWYLMGMGTEVDLHTPHWHGNTVTAMGMRTDVVSLLPASMVIADMVPDDVGTWLFHCHVTDHILAGMQALYTVKK